MEISLLQRERINYSPKLPKGLCGRVAVKEGAPTCSAGDEEDIKKLFPCTYGLPDVEFEVGETNVVKRINVAIILSGGQAPGGHNVICGIFDTIKGMNADNKVYGFILGPSGFLNHDYMELTDDFINRYRNTGGFDMIGTSRTKLETPEQFEQGLEILKKLDIKALVIVGGDDSNTNACILAEYYAAKECGVQVIGCPKTIDGDLKNDQIENSFGFDTATKTYSELIGNVERDCYSSKKYWHYIKLMGRSASHITLECALACQPNICLISEEVRALNLTLNDIVEQIASVVAMRASKGKNYGIILIPEGIIEFIPSINRLIEELNEILAADNETIKQLDKDAIYEYILNKLSIDNRETFSTLPKEVACQLSLNRDPHGNVPLSVIETEKLLSEMVGIKLAQWKKEGKYNGKYATLHHFFGYEGRCAFPSNYDANYCYALGVSAAQLIACDKTGYMAVVKNTVEPVEEWAAGGVAITKMMNMERRNGKLQPVIRKAIVDIEGRPFKYFVENRDTWTEGECYTYPGAIQYWGPASVCDRPSYTLLLEKNKM